MAEKLRINVVCSSRDKRFLVRETFNKSLTFSIPSMTLLCWLRWLKYASSVMITLFTVFIKNKFIEILVVIVTSCFKLRMRSTLLNSFVAFVAKFSKRQLNYYNYYKLYYLTGISTTTKCNRSTYPLVHAWISISITHAVKTLTIPWVLTFFRLK